MNYEKFPSRPEFREPDHPGAPEMAVTIAMFCAFIIVPCVALVLLMALRGG